MKKINLKGVTSETVSGVLILFAALLNAILQMFSISPIVIENEEITNIVSIAFLIGATLYNTWKNRNISTASQIAQSITDALKNGELLETDVKRLIDKIKS